MFTKQLEKELPWSRIPPEQKELPTSRGEAAGRVGPARGGPGADAGRVGRRAEGHRPAAHPALP
eukprot:11167130-Lingulodinium_polyedra.AAC.1